MAKVTGFVAELELEARSPCTCGAATPLGHQKSNLLEREQEKARVGRSRLCSTFRIMIVSGQGK